MCLLRFIIVSLRQKRIMNIDTIQFIVNSVLSTGIMGTFLFYGSRRRKENALARQEESKAISSYADEWKELYERSNKSVDLLNEKVDSLYEEINGYRVTIRQLRDEKNNLLLALHEAQFNRCVRDGCQRRTPPRKRKDLEEKIENDEVTLFSEKEEQQ